MAFTVNNNGTILTFETQAEHDAWVAQNSPNDTALLAFFQNVKTTYEDEDAGMFVNLKTRYHSATCVGNQTIDVATFAIPENIFGKTRIEVFIVDTVSGAFGIADIIVSWRRFTGTPAIGSTHQIIPLQTPGTLAGASLPALAIVDNTIVSRFTGVTGRTIEVHAKYSPTVYKF